MSHPTLWALTPSYRPVGGVVKILDYVNHALAFDHDVVIVCPRGDNSDSPLWRMDAFSGLRRDPRVTFRGDLRIAPTPEDIVLVSWPTHVGDVLPRLPDGFPISHLVHLVQNTRHANPTFAGGWGVRALARTMTRIMINDVVHDAVQAYLDPQGLTRVIPLGHDAEHFAVERGSGLPDRITVGYTTWKSDVGDRVARLLADDDRFAFRAVRGPADWDELRELYTASNVFLSTPGPQEGFYLPGLEAMAAGCLVLTPDAEGNLAYCWFDENCLEVALEDEHDYARRLREAVDLPTDRVDELRAAGRERVNAHRLDREREAFATLLDDVRAQTPWRVRGVAPRELGRRAPSAYRIVTGVPRSGTTLVTSLLNRLPNVVAMGEPLRPEPLMSLRSTRALIDAIETFFDDQRQSALTRSEVVSKTVDGSDPDNYTARPEGSDVRSYLGAVGSLHIDKPIREDVRLVVKDLAMCTAILPELQRRFDVFGIVRNPVAVLASWETVDMSVRDGHAPHAEWFVPELADSLRTPDRHERQLRLLDWWFERLLDNLPPERVLRYEDVVATGGAALSCILPDAADLDLDLDARNDGGHYAGVDLASIADRVLARPDAAWWRCYDRDDVVRLGRSPGSG